MGFEWDDDKDEINLRKHGVTFAEAATVFDDPLAITYFDPDHFQEESRFLTIGMSVDGRVLILSHTDRGENIRIISARAATRFERKGYENGTYP